MKTTSAVHTLTDEAIALVKQGCCPHCNSYSLELRSKGAGLLFNYCNKCRAVVVLRETEK
jgi:predicted  nucleic acid-binding Zn ribbon protein